MNYLHLFEYVFIVALFLRHIDHFEASIEFNLIKRFCKIVDDHLIDETIDKINRSRYDLFAHEMLLNIDVLRAKVKFKNFAKSYNVLIVDIDVHRSVNKYDNFFFNSYSI